MTSVAGAGLDARSVLAPRPLAYNVAEAADALRVSPRTVRTLIASHELRAHRIGRRVLVSADALSAFVKAREAEAAA